MDLNLGIRAHDIGTLSVEELPKQVAAKSLTGVQLALAKALDGVNSQLGALSPGFAKYVGKNFAKNNVQIAVLGCYFNPVDPDLDARRKGMERFKEHIRYARDFGCSIVATELGSFNSDYSFHPDNHSEKGFQMILESVKELVEEAEKFGVIVGVEAVTKYTIYSPKSMRRLLDAIPSNNVQVVFDPVNMIDITNYENQDEIIKEAFELLGDRMVIMHAKDFIVENDQVKSVPAGKGLLNYELILRELKSRKPYINVLMEDTQDPNIEASMKYLKDIYSRV
jgi:L-ribulose-5-phosphate 3-epimerase